MSNAEIDNLSKWMGEIDTTVDFLKSTTEEIKTDIKEIKNTTQELKSSMDAHFVESNTHKSDFAPIRQILISVISTVATTFILFLIWSHVQFGQFQIKEISPLNGTKIEQKTKEKKTDVFMDHKIDFLDKTYTSS